jgi:hypothetical protein
VIDEVGAGTLVEVDGVVGHRALRVELLEAGRLLLVESDLDVVLGALGDLGLVPALRDHLAASVGLAATAQLSGLNVLRSGGYEEVFRGDHVQADVTLLALAGDVGGIGAVLVVFDAVDGRLWVGDDRVSSEDVHRRGADLVVVLVLLIFPRELHNAYAGQEPIVEHVRHDVQARVLAKHDVGAVLGRNARHLDVISAGRAERHDLLVGAEHLKDGRLQCLDALKHVL